MGDRRKRRVRPSLNPVRKPGNAALVEHRESCRRSRVPVPPGVLLDTVILVFAMADVTSGVAFPGACFNPCPRCISIVCLGGILCLADRVDPSTKNNFQQR